MTRFELKKVFSRRINQIVLLVMAAVVVVCVSSGLKSVRYSVYDENGLHDITGRAAALRQRADAAKYEDLLTPDVLRRVIEDNARIKSMPEAKSGSIADSDYVFSLTQGYNDIRRLFALAYTPFDSFDYYIIDELRPEDADRFYPLRIQQLTDWFSGPDNIDWSSDKRCQFILSRYEALETPILYRSAPAWNSIFEQTTLLLLFMCFVLGFLLSGLFAAEYRLKTDSIFYSSYHGRKSAVWAKVRAGFIITNGVYWGCMLVFSAALLLILGAHGWDCSVQATLKGWESIYNVNVLQKYLIALACGWVGVSVISMICMFISAKTNSATLAMAVSALLLFLPELLKSLAYSPLGLYLLSLTPEQLMQINELMGYFNLYPIGGKIFTQLQAAPTLYLTITALLVPLVYQVYRKKIPA